MLKITTRVFGLILILAGIIACTKASQEEVQKTQPNFLIIAVDDLNTYNSVLGGSEGVFLEKVYPDTSIRNTVIENLTPNLDKFASQALTFGNAYCASPLCGPSRTALFTGVPTHISGYYQHHKHFRHYETLNDVVTLPQYLRLNGYFTSGIGKVFHKPKTVFENGFFSDWPDRLFSWTNWVDVNTGTGPSPLHKVKANETLSRYYDKNRGEKSYLRFGKTDLPSQFSHDYNNAQHIADLMTQGYSERKDVHGELHKITLPKNQPWMLACGLFAPHLPFIAPQECYDLFPKKDMNITPELRKWVLDNRKQLSATGQKLTTHTGFEEILDYGIEIDGEGGDINAWKDLFQAYLSTIAFSDKCLGVLFDAIHNNPEYNNTVVILFSDHGFHLGDKNREGKTTLWEASNRCNLMILDPKQKDSHGVITPFGASLQDIYPTIVSKARLERPKHVHGYDLTKVLQNPSLDWEQPVLSTYQEGNHTIRTVQYRYIRFANGDQELYDLKRDPFEESNLVKQAGNEKLIQNLDKQLNNSLVKQPNDY